MAGSGAGGGVTLTLQTRELAAVEARLAHAADGMARPQVLMKRVAAVLESSTRVRFRTGLAPDGTPWKPSIRVRKSGGKTLFDKGHLSASITGAADDRRAQVGSNLIYALIHQIGGVIRPKAAKALRFFIPGVGWRQVAKVTIPARPYLGVSESDRTEISDQVRIYIEQRLAA